MRCMHAPRLATLLPALVVCAAGLCADTGAKLVDGVWTFRQPGLTIRLTPRTPDQMAAFYEARGFPESMVAASRDACFFTVGIHNTSDRIVWLDLDRWRFTGAAGAVRRLDRGWWKARWEALDAPLPSQSTFRWTLLPESLDFRPDEREGGNITLPRSGDTLRVEARFATGADKHGDAIVMTLDGLRCAEDTGR